MGSRQPNACFSRQPASSILDGLEERLSRGVVVAGLELRQRHVCPHHRHRFDQIAFAGDRDALIEFALRLRVASMVTVVGRDHASTECLKRLVLQTLCDRARILRVAKSFFGVAILDQHGAPVRLHLRSAQFLTPRLIQFERSLIVASSRLPLPERHIRHTKIDQDEWLHADVPGGHRVGQRLFTQRNCLRILSLNTCKQGDVIVRARRVVAATELLEDAARGLGKATRVGALGAGSST